MAVSNPLDSTLPSIPRDHFNKLARRYPASVERRLPLTDVFLPSMLAKHKVGSSTLLSGYTAEYTEFLPKPIDPPELIAAVQRLVPSLPG